MGAKWVLRFTWGSLGGTLGSLGCTLGSFGGHMGVTWEHFWVHLGALLVHLGALGGTLGSLGGQLGAIWDHLVVLWGDLGTTWGQFGTLGRLMSVLSSAIWGRCAPHSSPNHFLDGCTVHTHVKKCANLGEPPCAFLKMTPRVKQLQAWPPHFSGSGFLNM